MGKWPEERVAQALNAKCRTQCGPVAPPDGTTTTYTTATTTAATTTATTTTTTTTITTTTTTTTTTSTTTTTTATTGLSRQYKAYVDNALFRQGIRLASTISRGPCIQSLCGSRISKMEVVSW